jgi:hypothetical protein
MDVSDHEQPWEVSGFPWDERPGDGTGEPIALELVWNMKSWEVIADKGKETLHIRGFLIFYWTDARLVGYPTKKLGDKPPEKIWRPTFITCAGFSLERGEKGGLLPEFYSAGVDKEGLSDGRLKLEIPISLPGGFDISNGDIDRFRSFPFDSTRVDLSCCVFSGKGPMFVNKDVTLSLRREQMQSAGLEHSKVQQIDYDGVDRNSNDYELCGLSIAAGAHPPPPFLRSGTYEEGDKMCDILLSFHIRRSYIFYLHNGVKPLYTIAAFGFFGYAMEPSDLANRVALGAVLFLSIYAVQWTTAGHIPRLPFKTVLDNVSESVSAVLFLILIGNAIAYHVARPERDCVDSECDFDDKKADRIDLICALMVCGYVLLYSVGYRTVFAAWWANRRTGASRPWTKGPYLRNKRFLPTEEAYHLKIDDAFVVKHGKKYLGQGEKISNPLERW